MAIERCPKLKSEPGINSWNRQTIHEISAQIADKFVIRYVLVNYYLALADSIKCSGFEISFKNVTKKFISKLHMTPVGYLKI